MVVALVALAPVEPAYRTRVAAKLTVTSRKPQEDVTAVIIASLRREAVGLSHGFRRFAKRCAKSSFFTMKFNLVVSKGVCDEAAD